MRNKNFHLWLDRFNILIFFAFIILITFTKIWTVDLWAHLSVGRWIVEHLQVPHQNLFSYTRATHPWVFHAWLFQVLYYLVFQIFSFNGLILYKMAMVCAVFALIIFFSKKKVLIEWQLIFGLCVILVSMNRFQERPELVSNFFILFFFYALNRWESVGDRTLLRWLPIAQVLWVNLHIYFFLGLLLVFLFIVGSFIQNRKKNLKVLIRCFAWTVVACLININGIKGAIYPLFVTSGENHFVGVTNELRPLNLHYGGLSLFVLIVVPLVMMGINRNRLQISHLLTYITFLLAAFHSNRHLIYYAFLSFALFSTNLETYFQSENRKKLWHWTRSLGVILFLFLVVFFSLSWFAEKKPLRQYFFYHPGLGIVQESYPTSAIDYLKRHSVEGPIFNDTHVGFPITYAFFPDVCPFIDTRIESYGGNFLRTYTQAFHNESVWHWLDQKYHFKYLVLNATMQEEEFFYPFLQRRLRDRDWKLAFYQNYSWVFIRSDLPQARKLEPEIHLPEEVWPKKPGKFLNNVKYWWKSSRVGYDDLELSKFEWVRGDLDKASKLFAASLRLRSWWPFEKP